MKLLRRLFEFPRIGLALLAIFAVVGYGAKSLIDHTFWTRAQAHGDPAEPGDMERIRQKTEWPDPPNGNYIPIIELPVVKPPKEIQRLRNLTFHQVRVGWFDLSAEQQRKYAPALAHAVRVAGGFSAPKSRREERFKDDRALVRFAGLVGDADNLAAAERLLDKKYGRRHDHLKFGLAFAEQAVEEEPDSYDAHYLRYRALSLTHNLQHEAALAALRLVEMRPDSQTAIRAVETCSWGLYPEQTVEILNKIRRDGPDGSSSLDFSLGRAYERLDRMVDAAEAYRAACVKAAYVRSKNAFFDRFKGRISLYAIPWALNNFKMLANGRRNVPSILKERATRSANAPKPSPENAALARNAASTPD